MYTNFFLEKGLKAHLTVTSQTTQIPYSTVSKIVNTNINDLPRRTKEPNRVMDSFSDREITQIKSIICNIYENNEVPTLEGIKAEFNKREFTYCLATLWKILRKISFTYKAMSHTHCNEVTGKPFPVAEKFRSSKPEERLG
jgi:hypothetical protein